MQTLAVCECWIPITKLSGKQEKRVQSTNTNSNEWKCICTVLMCVICFVCVWCYAWEIYCICIATRRLNMCQHQPEGCSRIKEPHQRTFRSNANEMFLLNSFLFHIATKPNKKTHKVLTLSVMSREFQHKTNYHYKFFKNIQWNRDNWNWRL